MTDSITPDTWEPPAEMAPIFHQVGDAVGHLVAPGETVDDRSAVLFDQVREWSWMHGWVLLQIYGWSICHGLPCPCEVAHPWLETQAEAALASETAPAGG